MTSVKQELPSGNAESAAMNSNAIWCARSILRAQLEDYLRQTFRTREIQSGNVFRLGKQLEKKSRMPSSFTDAK